MAAATLTRPTSAASDDEALDDLPVANVRKPGDFPESEFKTIRDVPVFAEHETVTRAGKPIKFGASELSKIIERCNRRIEETGDYAAITIGHTPGPEEAAQGAPQPEVIGYAGPFRLGVLGLKDGSKRYAILADEHIYLEDVATWRKHARRSPEVWLEDRFEEMFLDPIAHLGAEAPRLDMGLLYSAVREGRQVEKYAAVAAASPSPTSVFIPSDDVERRKNAAGDSGFSDAVPVQSSAPQTVNSEAAMTPQDIEQIVDAIDRLPWVGEVKQMLQERAAPGPGAMTPGAVGIGAGEESGPAPAGVGGERRSPPQAPTPPPAAGPSPAPVPAPEVKKNAAGEDASPKVDYPSSPAKFEAGGESEEEKKEREEYARLRAKYGADEEIQRYAAMCKKYAAGDASGEYQEVPPGGSKDTVAIPPGGAEVGKGEVKKNAAGSVSGGSADGVDVQKPAGGNVDEGNNNPGMGDAAGPTSDGAEPYRRPEGRERYAGEAEVLKLQRQNRDLQQRLQDQEKRTVESERYARLQDLRGRFAFDIGSSVEMAKYGKMNDEQFESHCQFIETSCRVIPLGSYLPGGDEGSGEAASMAPGRPGAGPTKERYSKQLSDQARDICVAAMAQGKQPDYERVLADLHAGRQPAF